MTKRLSHLSIQMTPCTILFKQTKVPIKYEFLYYKNFNCHCLYGTLKQTRHENPQFHLNMNLKRKRKKTEKHKNLAWITFVSAGAPYCGEGDQCDLWVQLPVSLFFVSLINTFYNNTVFSAWWCKQAAL